MTPKQIRRVIRRLKRQLAKHPRSRVLRKALRRWRHKLALANPPLRKRALAEALRLVGVMEGPFNNRGREVERIIAEGGGLPGQAWCGWFVAACYKRAGSKAVDWHWGAVRLMFPLPKVVRVEHPLPGDLVRFKFDHVGLFISDHGNSIKTVEGNTGATGAVSDSKTGGDGVYIKHRDKALVADYLRIRK